MRATADVVIGIVLSALAIFSFFWADNIQEFGDDPLGPKTLPKIVSILILILSVILVGNGTYKIIRNGVKPYELSIPPGFIRIVLPLWILLFVYIILFIYFGYMISTILVAIPAMIIFGNKKIVKIVIISIFAGIVYYYIFIDIFGMFDVPGKLFSSKTILAGIFQ